MSARATTERIAEIAVAHGFTVAVAESLTGGSLAAFLAAAKNASDWFAGGVVAYQDHIKRQLLAVPADCPVISAQCVSTMAAAVSELMSADAVVSISGAGGPEGQEGNPPGMMWIATLVRGTAHTEHRHFPGPPEEVVAQAREAALGMLLNTMRARP